ncbi:Uncharacterized protein APZ42_031927 [Daphnia magna]|uniref:Uncharacterized protein n=1 Tax=Daphnia magna TaxID=35525 RepID=A0A164MDY5_9CRUS|nr:Uncharacterized protein APZ42_031927 [Daphnia magna]
MTTSLSFCHLVLHFYRSRTANLTCRIGNILSSSWDLNCQHLAKNGKAAFIAHTCFWISGMLNAVTGSFC